MSQLFEGRWKIDAARSTVWDDEKKCHVPDLVGEEIITIRHNNGAQDYEVLYGDDPVIRMGYAAAYNSPDWSPYLVREIRFADGKGSTEDLEAFRQRIKATEGDSLRQFEVGKPYGLIRVVAVDELTHHRIQANPLTGKAQTVMQRRLSADHSEYLATVLDTRGIVCRYRWFVRT